MSQDKVKQTREAVVLIADEIYNAICAKADEIGMDDKNKWLFFGRVVNILFVRFYNVSFHTAAVGMAESDENVVE